MNRKFNMENFISGGAILLLAGIVGLYMGLSAFLRAFDQKNWVETEAVVTRSSSTLNTSMRQDYESFDFEYEYGFEGLRYSSSAYSARHVFVRKREPVENFREGDKISVHVNPSNPDQAFVKLLNPGFTTYLFTIGSVIALLGSYMLSFKPARAR